MRKILITGANSYVGICFEKYMSQWAQEYIVDTVDMRDGSWHKKSFTGYDVVFHVAGIAHSDSGKKSSKKEEIYRKINTELAVKTAEKAKKDGVKQFIFMSSAIVYGDCSAIGKRDRITRETPLSPTNAYSNSKAKAEKMLIDLEEDTFKIVILRPPMIYGKNCKGNYRVLAKAGKKLCFFPYVSNERSVLYIYNLTEFVRLMIENEERGIFWPQNREYINTSELIKLIAAEHGRTLHLVKGFGWLLKIVGLFTGLVRKAFGNLAYDMEISEYVQEYRKYSLIESIKETENVTV